QGMFWDCSNLTKLDLSSFDTSNVTDMSYMFYNCSKLVDLNDSSFDMSNVTNDTFIFSGCDNLRLYEYKGETNANNNRPKSEELHVEYGADVELPVPEYEIYHSNLVTCSWLSDYKTLPDDPNKPLKLKDIKKNVRISYRIYGKYSHDYIEKEYQIYVNTGFALDKEDKTNSEDEFVFNDSNGSLKFAHIWRGVEWDTNITLSATSKVDIGELSYSWAQVQLYHSGVGADKDDPSDDAIWYAYVYPGNVSNERAYTPIYNNTKAMEVSAWLCSSKDSCGNSISESYWICYNIHYNLNGGTNHPSNPKYVDGYDAITYPQELGVKKIPLYAPTRAGYKFEGWYENADFSGEPRTYLTVCDMKKLTLYAKWSPTSHTHKKTTVITKATTKKDGSITVKCSECGKTLEKTVIPSIKSVNLSGTSFTYDAKEKKPTVTVKDRTGKTISKSYYTVSYKDNKNVGLAEVTVKFKGRYEGTIKRTFTILPKTPALSKVKAIEKGLSITWKKTATQLTGYQIQIATDKSFKKNSKVYTISGKNSTSKKITKLKKNTKYYIRIRTYKTVGGKKYYSGWKTYSKAVRVSK
ncbi:InlB B-repeat-containing protein, partial [Agathobacter ruminis]